MPERKRAGAAKSVQPNIKANWHANPHAFETRASTSGEEGEGERQENKMSAKYANRMPSAGAGGYLV